VSALGVALKAFSQPSSVQFSDRTAVGTLCVIARQPLRLSDQQRDVLRQLGLTAVHLLEGRARDFEMGFRLLRPDVRVINVLQHLRQFGVHDAHGYHRHRPEPFEQLMAEAMANRPA